MIKSIVMAVDQIDEANCVCFGVLDLCIHSPERLYIS